MSDFFSMFRSAAANLAAQVKQLRADLERAKQQRERLISAPRSKADAIEALFALIDDEANKYPATFRTAIDGLIRRPLDDRETLAKRVLGKSVLAPVRNAEHQPTIHTLHMGILYACRPQVKEAIKSAVESMEWPEETGPLRAEREREIAKLEAVIQEIEEKLEQLDRERRAVVGAFQ